MDSLSWSSATLEAISSLAFTHSVVLKNKLSLFTIRQAGRYSLGSFLGVKNRLVPLHLEPHTWLGHLCQFSEVDFVFRCQ